MFYIVFCIAWSVVYYLKVNFSTLVTSVWEERELVSLLSIILVIMLLLLEGVSSSSVCLGKAALFYCCTP